MAVSSIFVTDCHFHEKRKLLKVHLYYINGRQREISFDKFRWIQ